MLDMRAWDQDKNSDGDDAALLPVYVTEPARAELDFSVVTLVADDVKYRRMLKSFEAAGFDPENSEFLAIDNRTANAFDGFSALRAVVSRLRGRYVLFTHEDIELTGDGIAELRSALARLDALDRRWMIAGNSGVYRDGLQAHLDDPHGAFRLADDAPAEVRTLDENFLVMPRERMPMPSLDLDGFHLYGTDMCLQAHIAGGTSYVIPFLLTHHSGGQESVAYRKLQARLQSKYAGFGIKGRLRAPASDLHFGWRGNVIRETERAATWLRQKAGRLARLFARSARHNTESK